VLPGGINGAQRTVLRPAPGIVTGLFPTIRPSLAASAAQRPARTATSSPQRDAAASADSSLTGQQSAATRRAGLIFLVIVVVAATAWLTFSRARRPAGKRRAR
jgi:hypothetical protein